MATISPRAAKPSTFIVTDVWIGSSLALDATVMRQPSPSAGLFPCRGDIAGVAGAANRPRCSCARWPSCSPGARLDGSRKLPSCLKLLFTSHRRLRAGLFSPRRQADTAGLWLMFFAGVRQRLPRWRSAACTSRGGWCCAYCISPMTVRADLEHGLYTALPDLDRAGCAGMIILAAVYQWSAMYLINVGRGRERCQAGHNIVVCFEVARPASHPADSSGIFRGQRRP